MLGYLQIGESITVGMTTSNITISSLFILKGYGILLVKEFFVKLVNENTVYSKNGSDND